MSGPARTRFYVEFPADRYGNTMMRLAVIEVRDEDGRMVPVAPPYHAERWPSGLPAGKYGEVDGPARMLSEEEHEALVEQARARG